MAKRPQVPKQGIELQTRLGATVRTRRNQMGITQEELAWRANMHRTYVAGIERGARNITLRMVNNLARALQVTVGGLFVGADECGCASGHATGGSNEPAPPEILMIEDTVADAEMALRAFKRAKINNPLRILHDAEDGLEYLFGTGQYAKRPRVRPQLVLLDLNLPGMSGVEFLRRIKSDPRTRAIAVVVLTVSSSDSTIIECGRLGAENYIIKPLGVESLIRVAPKLNMHLTLASSLKTGSGAGAV